MIGDYARTGLLATLTAMPKPGPDPLPPELKKTERLRVYGDQAEHAAWVRAAEASGKPLGQWVRDTLNGAAQKNTG